MLKTKNSGKKTTIGGQALIEGVMMNGVSVGAMAVRQKDGNLKVNTWDIPEKKWYNKAYFIRGCFNFVHTLKDGYKHLGESIDISGIDEDDEDEELSKFDIWINEHISEKTAKIIASILSFAMILIMLGVFLFLPSFLFSLLENTVSANISPWKSAFEGVMKLVLFVAYMAVVAQFGSMKRMYEYHGAEHKTIACYEAGKPLTVENIRPMCRFHPRCGTSFIIITLLVSILVYSVIPINPGEWWGIENIALASLLRIVIKLLFLPLVVGISYELIKLAGRYSNPFTKIISAPGLWMQRLTTREPDDSQIEAAVAAITPCLPKEGEDDNW